MEIIFYTNRYCIINSLIVLIFAILSHSEISAAVTRHTLIF